MDGTDPSYASLASAFGEPEFATEIHIPESNPGDAIDAEIVTDPESKEVDKAPFGKRRRKNPGEAKAGIPNIDEWMDFFSRIVIRFTTEWYVDLKFRGIDEDSLTDADAAKLLLDSEERDIIARPFAEYANKNPFMRKHGRQVVAFADSFESMIILSRWFGRVNRIAAKYRPQVRRVVPGKAEANGHSRPSTTGTDGSEIPGFQVYNPGGS